ncbi:hypothetical protein BWR59_30385 [Pseudomonas sp. Bc-h]|jgi:hypothetical protein|nr:hypothetical protein BWR59_30385 [Pseudomonas sp. Bc-h]
MTQPDFTLRHSRRSTSQSIQYANHQKVFHKLMGQETADPLRFEKTQNFNIQREKTCRECSSLTHLEVHE